MAVYLIVVLAVFANMGLRGSRMLVSLYALHLGTSTFTIGLLAATYALFPLLLAVHAGRIADRFGVREPIVLGAAGMAGGLLLPYFAPSLPSLFISVALVGLSHIFLHVAMHSAIGQFGGPEARTRNFGTFSLGASVATFLGPSTAGLCIDHLGYLPAFLVMAGVVAMPAVIVSVLPSFLPAPTASAAETRGGRALDLFAQPELRRALIMSGVTLTAVELFSFYFPIYGRAVGLSATMIGAIISTQASAAFIVRTVMHRLASRYTEVGVLTASLFVSAITLFAIPLTGQTALLAIIAFTLGLGLGCAQPITIILTYNHAPPGRSGEALGMRLTVNKLTQIAVPVVFGGMSAALGLVAVFWSTGLFLLGGGIMMLPGARRGLAARRGPAAARK